MSWQTTRTVEFQHCDPAGIVFYPRYFEMINSIIEEFFASHMHAPFAPMHFDDDRGVPTGRISVEFAAPSRLGDVLDFTLAVKRIGKASLDIEIICAGEGQARFTCQQTLVRNILSTGKSDPWPDDLRRKFENV
ncbi:MAG: acyl-CoA thioesterase [Alphaproteobacteria bacterium]|nr:acyl-CoA thioesterase [Alphaproteobacteria bacterium]